MNTKGFLPLLGTSLLLASHAFGQSNDFLELRLSGQHDDNISRALLASDRYSDSHVGVALSGGRMMQLRTNDSLTLFGELSRRQFQEFDKLSSTNLNLGASLQHKFGLGAYAPVLVNSLSWTLDDSETEVRKRQLLNWDLSVRKRLSPAWDFSAGVGYERSEGSHDGAEYASMYSPNNDIFDFEQGSVFVSADYTFANYHSLSASYTYVDGNTVSSALAPNMPLLAISKALTPDGAYPAPPWRTIVAYTLASKAQLTALNWSIPIGQNTSVTAGYSHQKIDARNDVYYSNDSLSLTLMHILK